MSSALNDAEAALPQPNKALEAFSYSVAHDLRSPLNTIDGFGRQLQKSLSADATERARHYLTRLLTGVRQRGEPTDGLLLLAQVSRTELRTEPVNLTAMAEQILEDCQERDAGRSVQVQVESGLMATGDFALLRQVMENLLANAWKFTAKTAEPKISVGKLPGGTGAAVYFVRDNGVGFDMAHVDKLFATFQRLHSPSEFAGTGIGLATSHRIISRHAGRIWAEGAPGQGATFFFMLAPSPGQRRSAKPRLTASTDWAEE